MPPDEPTPKPRLSERVRDAMQVRRYSPRTCGTYLEWIRRYWYFCGRRDPALLGSGQVTAFLTHLAVHDRVATATQGQALAAILFLYRHVLELDLPWLEAWSVQVDPSDCRPSCLVTRCETCWQSCTARRT